MKIKNLKINQKLLELYLIKIRMYEQYDEKIKNVANISINQTLINFKKILRIIFKFHKKNKKILFLGLNNRLFLKKINKETNHVAIPSKIKLHGTIFEKSKFNEKSSLLKLKKIPNLIIIFNEIENYNSLLSESFKYKIPTITFGNNKTRNNNMFLYNIYANTEFLLYNKNLFCNCLKFLLTKKTIKLNSKKTQKNEKKKI